MIFARENGKVIQFEDANIVLLTRETYHSMALIDITKILFLVTVVRTLQRNRSSCSSWTFPLCWVRFAYNTIFLVFSWASRFRKRNFSYPHGACQACAVCGLLRVPVCVSISESSVKTNYFRRPDILWRRLSITTLVFGFLTAAGLCVSRAILVWESLLFLSFLFC